MNRLMFIFCALLLSHVTLRTASAAAPEYVGNKSCQGCHKSEGKSWLETAHAKAFDSLMEGEKLKEKQKAKMVDKDYTREENCLPCHTVGFGKKGGYSVDMEESKSIYFRGVGCEMCHGPGGHYKKDHRKAGFQFKKNKASADRSELVELGQNFDFEEVCNSCHMNFKGSPWPGAKEPFTPFHPKVDPNKYKFNFEKSVRNNKAMHEHFKLTGVYQGDPIPPFRDEFQKEAKDADLADVEE